MHAYNNIILTLWLWQIAAEKLDEEASRYDKENPGAMMEGAKKIASILTEMAQLLRSESGSYISTNWWDYACIVILYSLVIFRKECVLKEKGVKNDIVTLAESINKESQEVARIAGKTAEACTDKTIKSISHGRIIIDSVTRQIDI